MHNKYRDDSAHMSFQGMPPADNSRLQGGLPTDAAQKNTSGYAYAYGMDNRHTSSAFNGADTTNSYSNPAPQNNKNKRGAGFWIAIVIAVLAVIAACFFAFRSCGDETSLRDPNQAAGQLEGKTEEEIQAELNRTVEEGMFNISIASVVEFADGTSEGELRIENVPGNNYLMQVSISRDDTGEVVYTSGIIEPNHHIQRAPLNMDLAPGDYSCTATFLALDPQTEEEVGQAAAKILIKVLG